MSARADVDAAVASLRAADPSPRQSIFVPAWLYDLPGSKPHVARYEAAGVDVVRV